MIAIIGILIALLLPAVQAAREAARRSQCTNNLKQIGVALHNYHAANGRLPFGSGYPSSAQGIWTVSILPFIEEQGLYNLVSFKLPVSDPANLKAATTPVSTFICPSDPQGSDPILPNRGDPGSPNPTKGAAIWYTGCLGPTQPDTCFFCANANPDQGNYCCQGAGFGSWNPVGNSVGMFCRCPRSILFREVTDGLSHTIMAGETLPGDYIWNCLLCLNFPVATTEIPINTFINDGGLHGTYDPYSGYLWAKSSGYKSLHPGGVNLIMGDGSVQFVDEAIDYMLYNNLGTRAGAEVAALP